MRPSWSRSTSSVSGPTSSSVSGTTHGSAARLWSATSDASSHVQRWARTAACGWSSTTAGAQPSSGHSRYRRARWPMKVSSESGSLRCAATLTCSGREAVGRHGGDQVALVGLGEAAVPLVGPLHRGAHGQPARDVEVLAHPDLLAVEQHRRAGEARTAASRPSGSGAGRRRASAAAAAAARGRTAASTRRGRRRSKTSCRSSSVQLVEGELVVVAHERGPLGIRRDRRPTARVPPRPGRRPPRASARYSCCIPMKSNIIVSSSPAPSPKNRTCSFARQVHLAEQDRVAGPAAEERPQRPQEVVRVALGVAVRPAGALQEVRDGVDPEAGEPQLEPEAHDLGDLVADLRVARC